METDKQKENLAYSPLEKKPFSITQVKCAFNNSGNYKGFIVLLVVLSVAAYNYSTEYLIENNVEVSQIMIYRGACAFFLGLSLAIFRKNNLLPNRWRPQIARFFLNGFASYLLICSFNYLSASTVAIVSRIDVPILIFFSVLQGREKSGLQFWLSIWVVAVVTYLAVDAKFINEEPLGFVLSFSSVILTSIGYFLVQYSAKEESLYIVNNVFSLSNLTLGIAILLINKQSIYIDLDHFWVFAIIAVSQLAIFSLTVKLFQWYEIERARLPFVFAAFIIMVIEMIVEKKVFQISQIGLSILITGMLITIIINPEVPNRRKFTGKM